MTRGGVPAKRSERFSSGDIIAGVSVALVLIPQSLAYAGIAGVPAHVGLLAAALPTIAAAFFASSPYLQTGPGAMTALLTFGALSVIATPLSAEYVALAALLALMVGLLRVVIGLTRFGVVAYFMSRPVIIGFTTGATILIAASQVPTLFGVERGGEGLLEDAWQAMVTPGAWHVPSLLIGVSAIGLIEAARRVGPRVPGVMIVAALGIVLSIVTGFDGPTVGDIPTGFPILSLDLPWGSVWSLVIPAVVIAFIGFTEAAAIASVYAAEDRVKWDPNREFVSQGVANLASGLSGGFPVGGSFSRSSINRLAGAKTRWSGAVTGLAVIAFLPAAGILEKLPLAVLGAIVVASIARLVRIQEIPPIWHSSRLQALVAVTTLVATLVLSPRIDLAVLLGVGMAVAVHLRRELRLTVRVDVEGDELRIAPRGVVFFGSTPVLVDRLITSLAEHPEVRSLVLDLGGVGRLDYTGGDALRAVIEDSQAAGLDVSFRNVPPHAERIVNGVVEGFQATA